MLVKFVQFANAINPMLVTLEPIITLVKAVPSFAVTIFCVNSPITSTEV